ncbi:transcriptional regulator SlyA [Idiomarina xiamenensis]|uniref:MarR family transcriptional regulator n=1 Tax=Idiomarina xiamenensis 10-D-4 TaxID=740709 RepID=K2KF90_9GAMM|nr:transcriptional regulator SlyA [Idiomarina xiamenensis]EKE85422.1 MarR family transcriptional regulator [Idiomarina xiamenensis 10-D-4]
MSFQEHILRQLSVPERLARVARLWQAVADHELTPLGLTYPRWSALWKLARLGDGISQKQLAQALEIEVASLMRTLGQLEQQQLIERRGCETDKRARLVFLTEQGKAFVAQLEQRILKIRQQLLEGVSDADVTVMRRVLDSISNNANYWLLAQQQSQSPEEDK